MLGENIPIEQAENDKMKALYQNSDTPAEPLLFGHSNNQNSIVQEKSVINTQSVPISPASSVQPSNLNNHVNQPVSNQTNFISDPSLANSNTSQTTQPLSNNQTTANNLNQNLFE